MRTVGIKDVSVLEAKGEKGNNITLKDSNIVFNLLQVQFGEPVLLTCIGHAVRDDMVTAAVNYPKQLTEQRM